jgi:hypothetical protein
LQGGNDRLYPRRLRFVVRAHILVIVAGDDAVFPILIERLLVAQDFSKLPVLCVYLFHKPRRLCFMEWFSQAFELFA